MAATLQIFTEAQAQHISVEISVETATRNVTVKGRFENGFRPTTGQGVAFRRSVIGNERLGDRVSGLTVSSGSGGVVRAERVAPHQFLASSEYAIFAYSMDLSPAPDRRSSAHASWIASDGGVLMLDDLLPVFGGDRERLGATVELRLPDGWRSYSSEEAGGKDLYDVRNVEGAVIFVGPRFRDVQVTTKRGTLSVLIDGEWLFSDADAAQMAAEIFDAYTKMLGPLPTDRSLLALARLPRTESPGQWEAETRGATVTIASSDMSFKTQSQQRLHEQLRHEIFHLWFPNAVELKGDYAWFYEGFALYQSLKLGVALKRIRFVDLLDTLSRAYTIDANSKPRRPIDRAGGADATVLYARGMVIAFLADIAALRASGGERDSGTAMRELFTRHKSPATGVKAMDVVKDIVNEELLRRYVSGTEPIDWTSEITAAGLEIKSPGGNSELDVSAKPSRRQKAILKRLGYN